MKELQASQALTVMLVQEERKRPSVEKLVMCIWNNRTKYSNVCDAYEVKLSEMDQQHYVSGFRLNKELSRDTL